MSSQKFDSEVSTEPHSDMARARAATVGMLQAISWDVQHVPETHVLRAENEILNMQITDFVDVINTHVKGTGILPVA
jgi:hypothetical protein